MANRFRRIGRFLVMLLVIIVKVTVILFLLLIFLRRVVFVATFLTALTTLGIFPKTGFLMHTPVVGRVGKIVGKDRSSVISILFNLANPTRSLSVVCFANSLMSSVIFNSVELSIELILASPIFRSKYK